MAYIRKWNWVQFCLFNRYGISDSEPEFLGTPGNGIARLIHTSGLDTIFLQVYTDNMAVEVLSSPMAKLCVYLTVCTTANACEHWCLYRKELAITTYWLNTQSAIFSVLSMRSTPPINILLNNMGLIHRDFTLFIRHPTKYSLSGLTPLVLLLFLFLWGGCERRGWY